MISTFLLIFAIIFTVLFILPVPIVAGITAIARKRRRRMHRTARISQGRF